MTPPARAVPAALAAPASETPIPQASPRTVDASMDLLNQILRQPVDPDYAIAATRPGTAPSATWALAVVAVVIGAMFAVSALQTNRTASGLAVERAELISRVRTAETDQDKLRTRVTSLSTEIAQLRTAALGGDAQARAVAAQINVLDPVVGDVAVRGSGLQIVVDDVPKAANDSRDRVLDLDLQIMVNGLWRAGAEAIAVNGHRLSTLTAIRGAGDAITVDYRSLTRPYLVQAIGDPRTLQARYVETPGGTWWNELADNRGMRYEVSSVQSMILAADPGMVLRYARTARR